MGVSAQQHRAATGCYAPRLWSSGWTPGSSGKAKLWKSKTPVGAKSRHNPAKGAGEGRSLLLLLLNLLVNTCIMVFVPPLSISGVSYIIEADSVCDHQVNNGFFAITSSTVPAVQCDELATTMLAVKGCSNNKSVTLSHVLTKTCFRYK